MIKLEVAMKYDKLTECMHASIIKPHLRRRTRADLPRGYIHDGLMESVAVYVTAEALGNITDPLDDDVL